MNTKKKAPAKKKVAKKKAAVKKKVSSKKKSIKAKARKSTEELDEYGMSLLQREFAELYRGGPDEVVGNAKRCYMKLKPNVTERTAEVNGQKLLRCTEVDTYLKAKSQEVAEKCGVNAEWLLQRLADESTADISDIYHEGGGLKPVHEWPLIWRQGLVSGLDVEQQFINVNGEQVPDGYITKVKMSDRVKRLDMIGKHVNVQAFKERIELTDNTSLADRMSAGRKRAIDNG